MAATDLGSFVERVRGPNPLVQCITNTVVSNFTANALLAAGAAPAMVDITGEAGPFARMAGGLLVNLGTPRPEQRAAAREAVAAATQAGTPWVLDPVAVGVLPVRTALAAELVTQHPTAIRGNPSEVLALAGAAARGRGVETADPVDAALDASISLARTHGTVVAVSGPEDLVTDGAIVVHISNGDVLLTKITGGGCALGALVAAFLAARGDGSPLDAVVAAHVVYEVAAEQAAAGAAGPGSFGVRLLDALAALRPSQVNARARVHVQSLEGRRG